MYARTMTWWTILRIALEERLVYRGDFALGTLMRFLPIITQIFLWWAVFDSVGRNAVGSAISPATVSEHGGLLPADDGQPGVLQHAGPGVRDRAADPQRRDQEVPDPAGRHARLSAAQPPGPQAGLLLGGRRCLSPFVFFLCRGFFIDGWPDAGTLAAFVVSLMLSFLLGFFLEASIGLIGFWFLEVRSLLFVYMLLSFFLSGHMFPLDMLPAPWNQLVDVLPLKYLAYFPAAVFLGKITRSGVGRELRIEAAWVVFFLICPASCFTWA